MGPSWTAIDIELFHRPIINFLSEKEGKDAMAFKGRIAVLILELSREEYGFDINDEYFLEVLCLLLDFKKNTKKLKRFLELILQTDEFYLDGSVLHSKIADETLKKYRKRKFKFNTTARYNEYLNSEHWQTLSSQLKKEVGACEVCRETKGLEVHHKSYANLKWEKREDLIVVCRKCHQNLHDKGGKNGIRKG